jgi:hypothetical protein
MRKYALAAICLVLLLVPMTATAHRNYPNESVGVNKSFSDDIYRFKQGEEVKVDVVSDLPIDVYIMTTVDYGSGLGPKYPGNFTPAFSVLNTTRTVFNWTVPDSKQYVIVVDNAVNNINGSANPSGTVTMTYIRTDNDDHGEALVEAISLFCIGVVAVIAIIFVVVIIIVLIARRRNKPVQAPPGSAQGSYGMPTPSQGYQPAPAQYPQQPGQYAPPPPPPGSPGVPPPPGQ